MSKISKRADWQSGDGPSAEELSMLANQALDRIEEKLKNDQSEESCVVAHHVMSMIGRDLDTFVHSGGGIEAERIFWPVSNRIVDITTRISDILLANKGLDDWYYYLEGRIEDFIEIWSVERVKAVLASGTRDIPLVITELKAAINLLKSTIEKYEKKFGSTFNPTSKSKLDAHIKKLETEFKVFLGEDKVSNEPVNVQTVDPDRLIDLYQEISKMPLDDENRLEKIREFERLQRILKSNERNKMKRKQAKFSRDFRKEALRNMDQLEKPLVQTPKFPVFKPDTETGIAREFDAPELSAEQGQLYRHEDPTKVISDYDLLQAIENMPHNKRDPRILRLKYLQKSHNMLLDQMFNDLGKKFERKEISDRFWDALPAEIRAKYKEKVAAIRAKIREIYRQFPQHFEQYKKENRPYFRKQEQQGA